MRSCWSCVRSSDSRAKLHILAKNIALKSLSWVNRDCHIFQTFAWHHTSSSETWYVFPLFFFFLCWRMWFIHKATGQVRIAKPHQGLNHKVVSHKWLKSHFWLNYPFEIKLEILCKVLSLKGLKHGFQLRLCKCTKVDDTILILCVCTVVNTQLCQGVPIELICKCYKSFSFQKINKIKLTDKEHYITFTIHTFVLWIIWDVLVVIITIVTLWVSLTLNFLARKNHIRRYYNDCI